MGDDYSASEIKYFHKDLGRNTSYYSIFGDNNRTDYHTNANAYGVHLKQVIIQTGGYEHKIIDLFGEAKEHCYRQPWQDKI